MNLNEIKLQVNWNESLWIGKEIYWENVQWDPETLREIILLELVKNRPRYDFCCIFSFHFGKRSVKFCRSCVDVDSVWACWKVTAPTTEVKGEMTYTIANGVLERNRVTGLSWRQPMKWKESQCIFWKCQGQEVSEVLDQFGPFMYMHLIFISVFELRLKL